MSAAGSRKTLEKTAEWQRLVEHRERQANWKSWGPYLSDRAWGTVREDYSEGGHPWDYFPHDHARSRAYRWGEDGLLGICDRSQFLCFGLALWNGRDPILKERLYGLTGKEGNHGEDAKEYWFYLDSTPTHSYMKALYKYPQREFPYADLLAQNRQRGYGGDEYELLDTGIFAEDRYFDVFVEYAKTYQKDILIQIEVVNRGPEEAALHVLPTLWFRNTWGWGYEAGPMGDAPGRPVMAQEPGPSRASAVLAEHPGTEDLYRWYADEAPPLIFTENDTNLERLYGVPNPTPYVKDAFHRYLIQGEHGAVNPAKRGTKAAAVYALRLAPGESKVLRLRLTRVEKDAPFSDFDERMQKRRREADEFYAAVQRENLCDDLGNIQRQALAGMLWSKQLYYYDVEQWLEGDPGHPQPPAARKRARNHEWSHLTNFDIISMPDKWEYPWYATWDLAFHCVPLTLVDPDFAKRQLEVLTREWYMHPNGQLPAYEWSYGDVNPPVHAWAVWRVYQIDRNLTGRADLPFLEGMFHKLMLNFTWWVNRKDANGSNIFQGGFLGLDNIGVFDRSSALPTGGRIDQSDGTSWMAAYCLQMLKISLELAQKNPAYQDMATKFFEHFLRIAHAMGHMGGEHSLWDEEDGFFYDVLHLPDGTEHKLKVRSMVGLLPLFAVDTIEPEVLDKMPDFERRMNWFMKHRGHLAHSNIASVHLKGLGERRLFAILNKDRLARVLRRMLDPEEFLSDHGVRSISKYHEKNPYIFERYGQRWEVGYWPAEARSGLFGGNSNWRGPLWLPVNYLIIESLQKFHHYYGDDFKVEMPTGSGVWMNLHEVARELSRRMVRMFTKDEQHRRPIHVRDSAIWETEHWRDHLLFYEYFHGDTGAGLGASHQTGWTGLVAKLIQQLGAV